MSKVKGDPKDRKKKPLGRAAHPSDRSLDFDRAIAEAGLSKARYSLRLYVTGNTPRSTRAIQNIRALCEEYLRGRYDLEIVDIHQQPALAQGEQIIAAPTLIKRLPEPLRKFVGDLSDMNRVLVGMDIRLGEDALGDGALGDGALGDGALGENAQGQGQ
jgi:circadian clock protein KaiB